MKKADDKTRKMLELSARILELIDEWDLLTQSDLQGCIEAVILDALNYKTEGII